MRRTKIVGTIGPASSSLEVMRALVHAGLNVARLNMSHGSYESHLEVIRTIRQASELEGRHVGILMDLCGPKIRIGNMPQPVTLERGHTFTFTDEPIDGTAERASISYDGLADEVGVGRRVLVDDGLLELVVRQVKDRDLVCEVIHGGPLSSKKGVNFPDCPLKVPAVTQKDWADLEFGLQHGVDFVALSFVRDAADVLQVKDHILKAGKDTPVIAKIEKFEALNALDEILHAADGAMVARGDLGVETAMERVPLEQKRIILKCRELGKWVITATQMLDSMIRNPRPTRAEVTDVANAVLDGTDAVMLSGESASGKFPVEAVQTMARICESTEESLPYERVSGTNLVDPSAMDALSLAACELAEELRAKVLIACTISGSTARAISRYRPRAPIVACIHEARLARRLCLSWGVFPNVVEPTDDTEEMLERARQTAMNCGLAQPRELAIIQAGVPAHVKGSTNMIKVEVLGHRMHRGVGAGPDAHVTARTVVATTTVQAVETVEAGDILVVPRLDEDYEVVLKLVAGVITAEGAVGDAAYKLLEKNQIPGILGVPDALNRFPTGRVVTLDVGRGLVYDV